MVDNDIMYKIKADILINQKINNESANGFKFFLKNKNVLNKMKKIIEKKKEERQNQKDIPKRE